MALDPQPVADSDPVASRCSSDNELPLNMKLLPRKLELNYQSNFRGSSSVLEQGPFLIRK